MDARQVMAALDREARPGKATVLARFFKTGKGEYGAGDRFLGVMVPQQRAIAKAFIALPLSELAKLLRSPIHEYRLTALLILTYRYPNGTAVEQERIFRFYLAHARSVNNWDLVDVSAPNIVGGHLLDKDRRILYDLVRSPILWERRIAIVATYAFIKRGDLDDTFRLAELLLADNQDLIHKAVGWMLREAGKRDEDALERFLVRHGTRMPRTMLRYAIERFPEQKRRRYLSIRARNA